MSVKEQHHNIMAGVRFGLGGEAYIHVAMGDRVNFPLNTMELGELGHPRAQMVIGYRDEVLVGQHGQPSLLRIGWRLMKRQNPRQACCAHSSFV